MGAHSPTLLSLGARLLHLTHVWRWYLSRDPPCGWFSFTIPDFSHAGGYGCLRLRSTVPKAVVYCNYTSYSISIVKFNALILRRPELIFILNKLQSNSTWMKYNYSERNKLLFKNAPTHSNQNAFAPNYSATVKSSILNFFLHYFIVFKYVGTWRYPVLYVYFYQYL